MLYTLREFLALLEDTIEGLPSVKRGQSKRKFSKLFNTSLDFVYRNLSSAKEPLHVYYNESKQFALILRQTHAIDNFSLNELQESPLQENAAELTDNDT